MFDLEYNIHQTCTIYQHMTVLKSKKYMLVRMKIQYNKCHQIVSQSF